MNVEKLSKSQREAIYKVIADICAKYGCSRIAIMRLIHLTHNHKGVSFVKIKSYNSDISNGTEVADRLINIGVNYTNQVVSDFIDLSTLDITKIDVTKFNYSGVNLDGVSLADFQKQVEEALPVAIAEMLEPKAKKADNDIHLNKVLKFNMTSQCLSLMGVAVGEKDIKIQGEFKQVKSAPKTIAKKIIQQFIEAKTDKIRRYKLDNLGALKVKGNELEIGGGVGVI